MGDIKKKNNKFSRPKKLFDSERIAEEKEILKEFGLKNKKEIWRTGAELAKIRRMAKSLIPKSEEEKEVFFEKLNKMGLKVSSIADVLGLEKEDLLGRRLQTFVFKNGLANSANQARQLIVHKKVVVDGRIVNIPSFSVSRDLENKISVIQVAKVKKEKVVKKVAEEKIEKTGENNG